MIVYWQVYIPPCLSYCEAHRSPQINGLQFDEKSLWCNGLRRLTSLLIPFLTSLWYDIIIRLIITFENVSLNPCLHQCQPLCHAVSCVIQLCHCALSSVTCTGLPSVTPFVHVTFCVFVTLTVLFLFLCVSIVCVHNIKRAVDLKWTIYIPFVPVRCTLEIVNITLNTWISTMQSHIDIFIII